MRSLILSIVVSVVLITSLQALAHPHIVDVAEKIEVSHQAFLDDLRKVVNRVLGRGRMARD